MNVVLWVLQGLLAAAFLGAGLLKLSRPKEKLADTMAWVNGASPASVKAVGTVEVLGALGLVLPALAGVAVVLTPLAALGLAITMVGALVVHATARDKVAEFAPAVVLLVLAVVVAWGRFGPYHF